jgi:transcriptional regulator with XRE-family HTH domain
MAWKKVTLPELADALDVDINEIDQKLRLRDIIIKIRSKSGLSQAQLAERVGVSRSRIAQIEAGIKLNRTSFDIFLRIIQGLGYRYKITMSKMAA